MEWNLLFYINSILLGVGLAMDAFSVSLANGLHEKHMKTGRMSMIAGIYAVFQFLMPMTSGQIKTAWTHWSISPTAPRRTSSRENSR